MSFIINPFAFVAAGGASEIAFVAASFVDRASTTTRTITKPTGVASGDVLIATIHIARDSSLRTFGVPTGFNLVRNTPFTSNCSIVTYIKVAGASEPADYTFTVDLGSSFGVGMMAFSGVNATTPVRADAGNTAANVIAYASVTPTAGDAVLYLVARNGGLNVSPGTTSNGVPSGATLGYRNGQTTTTDGRGSYQLSVAAGATSTATVTDLGAGNHAMQTIALAPA